MRLLPAYSPYPHYDQPPLSRRGVQPLSGLVLPLGRYCSIIGRASLPTLLCSGLLGLLGMWWVRRYLRNYGNSVADGGRVGNRNRSDPKSASAQPSRASLWCSLGLLLLGSATPQRLRLINRNTPEVINAVMAFGSYLTSSVSWSHFSYQNAPSISRVSPSNTVHLLWFLGTPLTDIFLSPTKSFAHFLEHLDLGGLGALDCLGFLVHTLAVVMSPIWTVGELSINRWVFKVGVRCISQVLSRSRLVIFSTIWFTGDAIR